MRCAYLMSYAHRAQLRCLCATLIVIHDEYDSRPYEPVTSFQQPKEVTKKGRPPTNFLIHIFIRLQCHSGERKHPCKALRLVQTSMSGHLTSQFKRWKIGVVNQSSDYVAKKAAFSSAGLIWIIMGVLLIHLRILVSEQIIFECCTPARWKN